MVLYLDEYINYVNSNIGKNVAILRKRIKNFEKDKKYIHEMSIQEVLAVTEREGGNSSYQYRLTVMDYLSWLNDTYAINTAELVYGITSSNVDGVYVGVYDVNDLIKTVDDVFEQYEVARERSLKQVLSVIEQDTKILYYLEWYGIYHKDTSSIRLSDVKDKGKTIFVPALNKDIHIDNEYIAKYIFDWVKTDEIRTRREDHDIYLGLNGNNLLRTTRGDCGEKYFNKIYTVMKDPRLSCNKVFYAGAFHRLYEFESKQCDTINYAQNEDYLKTEFYWLSHSKQSLLGIIRLYRVYKDFYLKWLSENKK